MSLFGMMRTGTAGMNAQASRLSTVADNIANASTTGYKRASTEFSSLILPSVGGAYNSGALNTNIRYSISNPGAIENTNSSTDLALDGSGFFIVQNDSGTPYLTRAGSFQLDSEGNLVNAAGYKLLGYDYSGGVPTPVVNGYAGLVPVSVGGASLTATPSTLGVFNANLDSREAVVSAPIPSGNAAGASYTHKSSLNTYDNLGNEVLLDIYYTKTGTGPDTWEVSMFNSADSAGNPPFPYGGSGLLGSVTLEFDANGKLATTSPTDITVTVPGGQSLTVDMSGMTQVGYVFTPSKNPAPSVNGNAPSLVQSVEVDEDGTVFAKYKNGTLEPLYRIALADVPSPDKLTPLAGNVYQQGIDSGVITTGYAGSGSFGKIKANALEASNVDIAEELTTMIQSQRSYTANSKVFQTGSELMDVLVNLAR
ncbi:flagellar hook protein FlgE [Rhizobium sp. L1K21]|uniref:flagellar hook protein FlgE n=1 Tax=Rhizobium sp. L1K21 TaxID=2954933 RepID=UPI00209242E4|nr:flagellar hook protein FlgE [Rhizobium sp. L1K21]MCO6187108.1 flagellar hook protein FlgE [Rhizobium sp. L1K21]